MKSERCFPKRERLSSKKQIDLLFGSGQSKSFVAFPLRAVWMVGEGDGQAGPVAPQVLVSVPKKRLRHAVDRNRAKRQVREAYRLSKQELLAALPEGRRLSVAFVWLSDSLEPSQLVSSRVARLLQRIVESL
ncbi:MAG: ribonuclease P protein component [Prevotella sp.]|nr:ribonuclease P protein component [Prevotella sp.]